MSLKVIRRVTSALCFLCAVAAVIIMLTSVRYISSLESKGDNAVDSTFNLAFKVVFALAWMCYIFILSPVAVLQVTFGFLYLFLKVKSRRFFIVGIVFALADALYSLAFIAAAIVVGGYAASAVYPLICSVAILSAIACIVFKSLCLAAYNRQKRAEAKCENP